MIDNTAFLGCLVVPANSASNALAVLPVGSWITAAPRNQTPGGWCCVRQAVLFLANAEFSCVQCSRCRGSVSRVGSRPARAHPSPFAVRLRIGYVRCVPKQENDCYERKAL